MTKDTQDIVIVTDANGLTLWVNEAFGKLTGYSLADIAGRKPGHVLQGAATDRKVTRAISLAIKQKQGIKTEILNYTKSGAPIWLDIEISPMFDDSSQLTGYIAIQRDISASVRRECDLSHASIGRQKAESRLRAAIEAISDGFAIHDEADRLVMANRAFRKGMNDKVTAGETFEALLRRSVREGLLDIGHTNHEEWISAQLKARRQPFSESHIGLCDGRWVSWRHKRTENNDIVVICSDISALKQHEAELNSARARAEAADQAKTKFLTNVSHEIRTPMNGIIGFNELLLQTDLTKQQKDYAKLIQSSSRSLLSLIDDILDLGKIERGGIDIEERPFKIGELVAAARSLEVLARKKNLSFRIDLKVDEDIIVAGDLRRIGQILTNLLGNAIKFTEQGRVNLEISFESGVLKLVIEDSGSGIAENKLQAVFEWFYQGSALASGQGSGLGLAIAKGLAEVMGGSLSVTSEVGQGSTFTACLPLANGYGRLVAEVPEVAKSKSAGKEKGSLVYDVLVAEDHPINRKLVLAVLQVAGWRTAIAENGKEAVAKLDEDDFDLIIMDSQMPIMNGVEATKAIRERKDWKKRTPILSLTADAMKGTEDYYLAAGADAYMSKPLKVDSLMNVLRDLVQRGRELRSKNRPVLLLEANAPHD